jgi:hypothetical protein
MSSVSSRPASGARRASESERTPVRDRSRDADPAAREERPLASSPRKPAMRRGFDGELASIDPREICRSALPWVSAWTRERGERSRHRWIGWGPRKGEAGSTRRRSIRGGGLGGDASLLGPSSVRAAGTEGRWPESRGRRLYIPHAARSETFVDVAPASNR